MTAILSMYWNICLLKQGPQYVPSQAMFLIMLVTVNLLATTILQLSFIETETPLSVFSFMLVSLAISCILVWAALHLKKQLNRFPQTISAMVGCDLLLTFLGSFIIAISSTGSPKDQLTQGIAVLFAIWTFAVWGYVLHHALNISVLQGISLSMAIVFISRLTAGYLTSSLI
jgi:hypothetical protein